MGGAVAPHPLLLRYWSELCRIGFEFELENGKIFGLIPASYVLDIIGSLKI